LNIQSEVDIYTWSISIRLKGLKSSEIFDSLVLIYMHNKKYKKLGKHSINWIHFFHAFWFNGDNKRKVSTALAFMANPALVFLDESITARITWISKNSIVNVRRYQLQLWMSWISRWLEHKWTCPKQGFKKALLRTRLFI